MLVVRLFSPPPVDFRRCLTRGVTFLDGTERASALHGLREPELLDHDILGQA